MTCLISTNGEVAVCGAFRQKRFHSFTKDRRVVFLQDSMWYQPMLVAKRERGERKDRFEARVKKQLGFMPMAYRRWWRTVAVPQLRRRT